LEKLASEAGLIVSGGVRSWARCGRRRLSSQSCERPGADTGYRMGDGRFWSGSNLCRDQQEDRSQSRL